MKRIIWPLLLVVVLVAIAMAGYWLKRPAASQAVACADPLAGCVFIHRSAPVSVRFSRHPAPLEAFELRVTAPAVGKVSAQFRMVGMDMGFNRYDLHPANDGAFASTVTLPVCVSGRHDWLLYLDLDGASYALPFSTE